LRAVHDAPVLEWDAAVRICARACASGGSDLPRAEILLLQSGQGVDLAPESFESLSSDLEIKLFRNLDHLWRQLALVLGEILSRQGLVGEAHVHYLCRMSVGTR